MVATGPTLTLQPYYANVRLGHLNPKCSEIVFVTKYAKRRKLGINTRLKRGRIKSPTHRWVGTTWYEYPTYPYTSWSLRYFKISSSTRGPSSMPGSFNSCINGDLTRWLEMAGPVDSSACEWLWWRYLMWTPNGGYSRKSCQNDLISGNRRLLNVGAWMRMELHSNPK